MARLLSINVGVPRDVTFAGRTVTTGIYKSPVSGRVRVGRFNLEGDGQADLRVHGGVDKAVYAYPFEHYPYWAAELGCAPFGYGHFGENLTVEGLLEDEVCIGDVLRVGGATLEVSQPRSPCFKLGVRMELADFPARFREIQRTGFYLRVQEEGPVEAPAPITRVARGAGAMSVRRIFALRQAEHPDADELRAAITLPGLASGWREAFQKKLDLLGASPA